MSISVKCEECGKTLKAPDSAAGKKAKCPQCGSVVKIPEAIYEAEEVSEEASNTEEEDPFGGIDSYDSPAVPGEKRKPCPACGEMIVAGAAKCRYCGEIFDAKLKKATKKKKSKSGDAGDDMSTGDWVVAILCSNIGCIAGIVWMIQGKSKGGKMILVSIVANICWFVVGFIIGLVGELAKQH